MNWDDAFRPHYSPVNRDDVPRCRQHPGHAIFTHDDDVRRCTSGSTACCSVPDVSDHSDRVASGLRAVEGTP